MSTLHCYRPAVEAGLGVPAAVPGPGLAGRQDQARGPQGGQTKTPPEDSHVRSLSKFWREI